MVDPRSDEQRAVLWARLSELALQLAEVLDAEYHQSGRWLATHVEDDTKLPPDDGSGYRPTWPRTRTIQLNFEEQ